ncbi:unnamed protein product [Linum trigynum]|uniref:Uncharacterized protein n=1 Tax=Linum trigynum TaxID=586398 RepID=A0AAV2E880_9ROSI
MWGCLPTSASLPSFSWTQIAELRVREIGQQLCSFDIASQVQLEVMPVHFEGLNLQSGDLDGAIGKHLDDREWSRPQGAQLTQKESQAGIV